MTGALKGLGALCVCAAVVGLVAGGSCVSDADADATGGAGSGGSTGVAGSGGSAGSGGGIASGGGCGTLTNDAPGVAETAGSGTISTMTGGTLVDGTYFITARLDYSGGTCGCTNKTTAVISGGGTMLQAVSRTDTDPDVVLSGTITTTGNMMSWNFTCPATMTLTLTRTYTATATTFVTVDQLMQVETYTKQ